MAPKENTIRIQSGTLKGRNLFFPTRPGLRPATGEMRETLFNWIRPYIDGMRILDAFAGSGALGIEALSQGAASVKAFEIDFEAYEGIVRNINRLPKDLNYEIIFKDFISSWNPYDHFDAIFLDPPYLSDLLEQSLSFLANKLGEDTLVFIHHSETKKVCLSDWVVLKQKMRRKRCYALLKTKQKD